MAIIKCKMCGGDLRLEEDSTVCECEYCGTRQTVPSADNEKKLTLFSRAGRLLRACEFDKAAGVFETIVADFPEEAEAYWGLVLCKYGIEYVDDPATGKKIPTCHRSSFDSVLDDPNFEQACENTDALARRVYRDEARQIEDLRKRIIEVSGKEEPYDVFISYKETDENGDRTLDSVIAQDIYTELTEKGYRVFFSRISLEDKLGTEYEPYIFAALNSAKVMLVVGTDYENFDSVWVKNEWSRFLKLIASGQKKTLIPVFKNMDAYDMPKEFAKLAAQDMGKVGAMQDLVRGVEKLIGKKLAENPKEIVAQQESISSVSILLKRVFMFLEDCEWNRADDFCEQILNQDPENAQAYLGKLMAEQHVSRMELLADCEQSFENSSSYQKAVRFGDESISASLKDYIYHINTRNERLAEEAQEKVVAVANAISNRGRKDGPTLEEKLAAAKNKAELLSNLLLDFDTVLKDYNRLTGERTEIELQKENLSAQRVKLGFFAGKERKKIDDELAILAAKKDKINAQLKQNEQQRHGYSTSVGIEQDIDKTKSVIIKLEDEIKKESKKRTYSYSEAIQIYLSNPTVTSKVNAMLYPKVAADSVIFGRYVQTENGPSEPVEWQVLDKQGDRILVISKYALDCQPYNESRKEVTWETCTLRNWMNSTFLSAAFIEEERAMIPSVTVNAEKNPDYRTDPGKSTTDQVFLLSISEANKYFNDNDSRQCKGTAYCDAHSGYKADNGNCFWWLRSPGQCSYQAASITLSGVVCSRGYCVDGEGRTFLDRGPFFDHVGPAAIRPALWIDLTT